MVLLFSLRMVTFLLPVKILAMSVRADRTATDLARLILPSRMGPRTRPYQPLRVTPATKLKALVHLKIKIKPQKKIYCPNSQSEGPAVNRVVVIQRPTVA